MDDGTGINPESSPESHPRENDRPGFDLADSFEMLVPIVLFVLLNRFVGLRWAVIGATIWSVKVVLTRRRRGLSFGRFLPLVTAAVIGRGVVGVLTESEALYFGLGIGTKYAVAATLAVSVLARRPLASIAAANVFTIVQETQKHPVFRSTMAMVSVIGAVYYLVSATFDIWLYRRSSVEGYVIVRFLVNWPLSVAAGLFALLIMRRRLPSVPGLKALNELLGITERAVS